ncbi:MAG: hypothetical protein KTR26_14835 [Flammeovirgaceae bacterium]|nr:hypothetical protein [Flammeovirgaceae bacterium]
MSKRLPIMNSPELESLLYQKLYDFFLQHGFEMMAGKKQFRKTYADGFQNVIFSISQYEEEFFIDMNIGIRFSLVEDIAQQFLDNHKEYHQDSNTLIISIGKFTRNKYFRYKIMDLEDLNFTVEEIQFFLHNEGFSFLNKTSNLKTLDLLLNKYPKKSCKYLYNQSHRCFKGIIVAKLRNNPKFLELVKIYKSQLTVSGAPKPIFGKFERLAGFLATYSVN